MSTEMRPPRPLASASQKSLKTLEKRPRQGSPLVPSGEPPAALLAREDVAYLARHLKAHVRAIGGRSRHISLRMGRGKDYLCRAFAGTTPLKMKALFEVFVLLGQHPRPFFNRLYPLAGEAFSKEEAQQLRTLTPESSRIDDLVALGQAREGIPSAEEGVERARRLLKRQILERQSSQRAVSVSLGLDAGNLVQALNHGIDLEAWHVFGVLRVLGVEPGVFFRELVEPEEQAPGGVTLAELLPALQRLLSGSATSLHKVLAEAQERAAPGEPTAGKGARSREVPRP